ASTFVSAIASKIDFLFFDSCVISYSVFTKLFSDLIFSEFSLTTTPSFLESKIVLSLFIRSSFASFRLLSALVFSDMFFDEVIPSFALFFGVFFSVQLFFWFSFDVLDAFVSQLLESITV